MLDMPPQAAAADNIMPEVEAVAALAADELCPLALSPSLRPAVRSFVRSFAQRVRGRSDRYRSPIPRRFAVINIAFKS